MLTVTFEETYKDSREINITRENISQEIVATICGDFFDEAEQGPGGLYNDDVYVVQAAFNYLPVAYELPLYNGFFAVLIIASIRLRQINNNTWEVRATYDIPQNGGQSGGGMGQAVPEEARPDFGENNGAGWSDNFTQISVNMTTSTRNRGESRSVIACQRSVNIGPGAIPYATGRPAPIGHTNDGIAGTEVYEREFGFSITAYMPPEKLKYAYVRKLARMQTTKNVGVFFGFAPGSVLFLEASFSGDTYQVVPVTFDFKQKNNFFFSQTLPTLLADPNTDNSYDRFYEPDFEDSAIISGWDHVDYRYLPVADTGAVMVTQRPVLRVIHQLYEYADFNELEI